MVMLLTAAGSGCKKRNHATAEELVAKAEAEHERVAQFEKEHYNRYPHLRPPVKREESKKETAMVKPRTFLSQSEWDVINAGEQFMQQAMNAAGYKSYCAVMLNEEGTIDIVLTSGSFKDSVSKTVRENYIGAAVAITGVTTSKASWQSRKLTIKVGFGKFYEISTYDCRKCVELFNNHKHQECSNYLFAHLIVK